MDGATVMESNEISFNVGTVVKALQHIYDPLSSNDSRKHASAYLESLKRTSDIRAALSIVSQAVDRSQPGEVRYYGFSVVDFVVAHRFEELGSELSTALREWVVTLATSTVEEDAAYIHNKIAQLWLEFLKRTWPSEWVDMDEQLVGLWEKRFVHKEMVLYILEMLSEDVFIRDDPAASLRDNEFRKACVAIFIPASTPDGHRHNRLDGVNLRYGQDGWLVRIRDLLKRCLDTALDGDGNKQSCVLKILETLRSILPWVPAKSVITCGIVAVLFDCLVSLAIEVRLASVQALIAIYSRTGLHASDLNSLLLLIFRSNTLQILSQTYQGSIPDVHDLEEQKYTLCKKLAELISCLGNSLVPLPPQDFLSQSAVDLSSYSELSLSMIQNPSFIVSVPVLHIWTKLLDTPGVGDSTHATHLYASLLRVCSDRLFRYEALPANCDDPVVHYLNEDFDTIPERHAFISNYRRFCLDTIEVIVRQKPFDAMQYVLAETLTMFKEVDERATPPTAAFSKTSPTLLRVEAQCRLVLTALRSTVRWLNGNGPQPRVNLFPDHVKDRDRGLMQDLLERWLGQILQLQYQDPSLLKTQVVISVEVCLRILSDKPSVIALVVGKILSVRVADKPDLPEYSEAARELESVCVHELQRVATTVPNQLLGIYVDLQARVSEMLRNEVTETRHRIAYQAFLLTIIQRSSGIDEGVRQSRMQSMLNPIRDAWRDPGLTNYLSSFESFCESLGMAQLPNFLESCQANKIPDWSSISLDERGMALQTRITGAVDRLPLRATRALLVAMTEKLLPGSQALESARRLWHDIIPEMLPSLLLLISYSHSFHNPANWGALSDDLRAVLNRILSDRIWQAGISTESRDVFYAKIVASKATLEGFGSTVRGAVRQIRETAYWTIYALTSLGEEFYGIVELAAALTSALFDNSEHLSVHQNSVLLTLVQGLVSGCPPQLRCAFLPPLLATFFAKLDLKIRDEWSATETLRLHAAKDSDLDDEMKNESILRTVTYSAVGYVTALLGLHPPAPTANDSVSISEFIFSAPESQSHQHMLENLILFCTHGLRMRDSRSCIVITRIFHFLVDKFATENPAAVPVREFISKDVLMACIESLHEPYFVDVQKDLATVIASIMFSFGPRTNTPRQVIMSLPGMREDKVDRAIQRICESQSERQQRALVLDMLHSVRGVSIHEQGRIDTREPKVVKSTTQERYMAIDDPVPHMQRGDSADLAGVADMFGTVA